MIENGTTEENYPFTSMFIEPKTALPRAAQKNARRWEKEKWMD